MKLSGCLSSFFIQKMATENGRTKRKRRPSFPIIPRSLSLHDSQRTVKTSLHIEGLFTWREEDPSARKVLEGGSS